MPHHARSRWEQVNSLDELVNKFADYFTEKIQSIREQITDTDAVNSVFFYDENVFIGTKLSSLLPASEYEVRMLISRSSNKSCCLDPIPAQLIKLCMDELVPIITLITNMSLISGVMPSNLKEAVLIPLLKKIRLDPELFKNFRPVSNLTFLSKLIERAVALRLHDHIKVNNLYEEFQSSYRKFHSTETAFTSVHDDILRHIDEKQCVILLLLDLSAAFDTIDHNILLSRLQSHLKDLYWAQFSSPYICCPLVISSADMDYNTICMPMTASFMLHSAVPIVLIVWPIWRLSFVI